MKNRLSCQRSLLLVVLSALLAMLGALSGIVAAAASDPLTLTVLYDNIPFDKNLQSHWGFSCLVEKGSTRVLFDTGAQPETLL
ncbi:MAG: hypothetical protein EHM23_02320, partial [Acidobacteria bacterium]